MKKITFDNLPQAVALLLEKVEKLEDVLYGRQSETKIQEKPMGVKEAAAFLELAVPTIYSKVSRGDLPAYKSGRKLYFDEAMLIKHIKSTRKQVTQEMEIKIERTPLQLPKHQKRKAFRWQG
ncbi:helix-turn-helix domain-containing protein [Pedobacter agri]|uniref:helix-turn-helix domain-containing protein n=1 Tax=Pedobacter agri TaxID=454586 RepID=UPI002930863A|nr:helix-turn-helix domain-containing protein [Pedobacter agri]